MSAGASKVLLVQHGPRLGRFTNYANVWLRHADRHAPDVRRRLLVHDTGGGGVPSLSGVGAVVFLLADPLRERYPACFEEAAGIVERARELGLRIVNPPETLSNTIKSVQADLWQAAGIPCASSARYGSRAELDAAISQVPFPAIIRPDLLHAQQYIVRCETPAEAAALQEGRLRYPGLLLQFIDSRAGWKTRAPDTVWARFYHRCRVYVFGDRVIPQAIYFSENPIVASDTSTFRPYKGWGMLRSPLLRLRPATRRTVLEDIRFAEEPPEQPELFVRAVRALGLDFAAVDYARLAEGSLVLWEANPHPALPVWRYMALPMARRLRQRCARLNDAAVQFLAQLG